MDAQVPPADAFERLLRRRHSTRAFQSEPVPDETIDRLLRMAQLSPSWCNTQPWTVHLVTGTATAGLSARLLAAEPRDKAFDIPPPESYSDAQLSRRRASGYALYDSVGIARDDHASRRSQSRENLRFFGAPQLVILTIPADLGPYAAVDAGAYVAHFLLAATSLGLGSLAQAAVAGYSAVVRDVLRLPAGELVVAAVAFGYSDESHPINGFRTSRAGLHESVVRVPAVDSQSHDDTSADRRGGDDDVHSR